MEQIKNCTDCVHYDSCKLRDYIDNPERTSQLSVSVPYKNEGELILKLSQYEVALCMAPNKHYKKCPRFEGSKLSQAVLTDFLAFIFMPHD